MNAHENAALVILTRLESLRAAIAARRWGDVEWEFDRVLRATTKAREIAREGGAS